MEYFKPIVSNYLPFELQNFLKTYGVVKEDFI